jgi:hypothetical protein
MHPHSADTLRGNGQGSIALLWPRMGFTTDAAIVHRWALRCQAVINELNSLAASRSRTTGRTHTTAELFYRWSRHRAHREKCIAAALDTLWAATFSWKPCSHSLPGLDDRIRPIGRFDLHRSAVILRDGCPGSCAGSRPGRGLGLPDALRYAAGERPQTCSHPSSGNQPRKTIMGACHWAGRLPRPFLTLSMKCPRCLGWPPDQVLSGANPAVHRAGSTVTYVIVLPCVDIKDKSCTDECPVDNRVPPTPTPAQARTRRYLCTEPRQREQVMRRAKRRAREALQNLSRCQGVARPKCASDR